MKPNPITQHLTQNHRWPSLRGAGLIALGVCAVSMTALGLDVDAIVKISVFAAWILTALNPLVIAVQSPLLIRKAAVDEQYLLLKLTTLSSHEVWRGFKEATLFRVRVMLATQIGLLPVWVIETFSGWYSLSVIYHSGPPPEDPNLAVPVIAIMLMGIGLFGLNFLAAGFGVEQGFHRGYPAENVAVSLVLILRIPMLCYIPALAMLGPTIGILEWDLRISLKVIGLMLGWFVLPTYVLAADHFFPVRSKEEINQSHET